MAFDMTSIRVVVGLDFGTTRSGFAYGWVEDNKEGNVNIIPQLEWSNQPFPFPKTLTQLLYSDKQTVEAWGWDARLSLAEKRQANQANSYHFFKEFKMLLHEGKNRDPVKGPYIQEGNQRFFVLDLISKYLSLIKDFALSKLQQEAAGNLKATEILWCLTVPAIWTNASKQLMREAAQRADIIGSSEDEEDRLLIVLEPEAAAQYCIVREQVDLQVGNRFMVFDAGGGTIDITVHEVTNQKGLEEVIPGLGGPYGSTKVDTSFRENFLAKKVPIEALERFHDENPIDYLKMMDEWEQLKCAFDPSAPTKHYLPIPAKLYRLLLKHYPKDLERLANEQNGEEAYFILDSDTLKSIFDPILAKSIALIEQSLAQIEDGGCDFIYLVGGFSTSRYLQQRINQAFGSKIKIVSPPAPGAAIVEGAVLLGLNPSLRSRRSRLTYGFGCAMPFQDGKDPASKRFWSEVSERYFCNDRFSIMVVVGDSVGIDQEFRDYVRPSQKSVQMAEFSIYATPKKYARYTDESGVTEIGKLICHREGDFQYSEKGWEVIFYFGKSELVAVVHDLATGKVEKADLRFSQTYSPELLGS